MPRLPVSVLVKKTEEREAELRTTLGHLSRILRERHDAARHGQMAVSEPLWHRFMSGVLQIVFKVVGWVAWAVWELVRTILWVLLLW